MKTSLELITDSLYKLSTSIQERQNFINNITVVFIQPTYEENVQIQENLWKKLEFVINSEQEQENLICALYEKILINNEIQEKYQKFVNENQE